MRLTDLLSDGVGGCSCEREVRAAGVAGVIVASGILVVKPAFLLEVRLLRSQSSHNMENLVEQQQNSLLIGREAESLELASIASLTTLQLAPEPLSQECYICDSSEVCRLKCGHALCLECIQGQIEHLPKKGQRFTTRNAKCGICSSWIEYEEAPPEFARIKEREDALLERLKADNDPDPELPVLLSSGSLLSKWQFMICG